MADDMLTHLVISAGRQLRRRLNRQTRQGAKHNVSPLRRAAQQLMAELNGTE